ncbi:ABC transporter permease YtrF [Streptomyces sp. 111WW2]|uniref:ABC transporter permease n=1 Tax=Streptomyces sp. 111WW2 TaxID=1945515 RepID=UPI000D2DD312|nr:ABC transporter permease [Streptomyces sp. 111WW2]PSK52594.1 ABC transporter permease YtrF [Streptomyces sp. 111WW2]
MLTVALCTLRTRWVTFTGSFVALALGVALLAVTGRALAASLDAPERAPERFAAAPVVVRGQDTLRVPTPSGDRTAEQARVRPVPAPVVARLERLGTVVEDRSFPVRVRGGRGPGAPVGHPWSTAAFAPYRIDAGRAPRAADEVVVTGGWAAPGERVRTDRGTLRVVGTVPGLGFEDAVFFTDARAAELAPRSVQLAVDAEASAVREAVREAVRDGVPGGAGVRVLTGAERRYADADPHRDEEALTALNALFGTAGGVSAFVSVFVVSSTFAFAVAQRRREFGLLRTAGATPGQLRRTVLAEAAVVGVLASGTGCVLGAYGAPPLTHWVVGEGLAPAWFTLGDHTWPYHLAFWTGLLVALCGAAAASWRAGRTGPVEALREAAADAGATTRGRWLSGLALPLTALVTLVLALADDPGDLLHRKTYVTRPMLLITAAALLAPVVVRPLTRLLTRLPARLPGATGLLVRENAATGVRRTAALAAPVLVTVALTGSLLGAVATLDGAKAAETRARTTAAYVAPAPSDAGFGPATLDRLRAVPGARISPSAAGEVYVLEDGVALVRSQARAVADPGALAATARLPVAKGRVADLDDRSIIVNEEWREHTVGRSVRVWLGDGTERVLRIAAVLETGTGDNGVYVTAANAAGAPVDRVDVALADGADPDAVAAGLRAAVAPSGGRVSSGHAWADAASPGSEGATRAGLLLVLGIALLYTGISVVNTVLMAAPARIREQAVLRLAGATDGQVLRVVAAESLTVVAVGTLLGLAVAGLDLAGMWAALALLSVPAPPVLPWAAAGTVAGVCAVLAATASVVPAALALRRRGGRPGG